MAFFPTSSNNPYSLPTPTSYVVFQISIFILAHAHILVVVDDQLLINKKVATRNWKLSLCDASQVCSFC